METSDILHNSPIIIAEAGVNHNGSLETALRLVDAAVSAGADYVKFQTFKTDALVTASASSAGYQERNCRAQSQAEMLRKLELSYADFHVIAQYCHDKGIGFLSTPFDMESIDFITSMQPDFMKVPSGEITNLPYLRKVAVSHIPAIISTGMSTITDVEEALKVFYSYGYSRENLFLLHCNTQYPTPLKDVNLRAMNAMEKLFGIRCGYSDHTEGIEVSLAAAARDAVIIEKHFTLDRDMEGPDHKASLSPLLLKEMVRQIRHISQALGSANKEITTSERGNMGAARKSIVAKRHILKGELLSEDNLTAKRPGTGISPMQWDEVIGKCAKRDFLPDELIEF